jgi:ABC-type uncharacterized transport system permease subunit
MCGPAAIIWLKSMPGFWLRVALSLYGVGLVCALASLWGGRKILTRITMPAVGLGMTFHFVSIIENAMMTHVWTPAAHEPESLLAFLLVVFFFAIYTRYRATAPGLTVLPLVFLLTAFAALRSKPAAPGPALFVSAQWIFMHIALIMIGYAALLFSFIASILYLLQERSLKAKTTGGFWARLPALATIDEIGYKCLVWGFPFMTLGLIAGSILAETRYGSRYFADPQVLLSILMWVVYTVLLYTRWNAGWRGRRAAYMATFAFAAAVVAWAANNLSQTHRFIP